MCSVDPVEDSLETHVEEPKLDPNDNNVRNVSQAPEIFVEGYRGVAVRAGIVKINFFANRLDPSDGTLSKHAAVTLTIPVEDFLQIIPALAAVIDEIRPTPEKQAAEEAS